MNPKAPVSSKRYPSEYNSWKMMKVRAAKSRCTVHPKFEEFEEFLAIMLPKKDPTFTLDRIDTSDPEYAPGKVRWASKRLQTRNRKNTVFLTYTGDAFPHLRNQKLMLTEWAELTAQPESTLRRRRSEGFSENEVIDGVRDKPPKPFSEMGRVELIDHQPWQKDKRARHEAAFLRLRKPKQSRFDFLMTEIQPLLFEMIRTRYKHVAYYVRDEIEQEQFERADSVTEFECWGKRPDASEADWNRLLEEYQAWRSDLERAKKERKEWDRALHLTIAQGNNSPAAAHIRKELLAEHFGSRGVRRDKPKSDRTVDDDWAARSDDDE